MLILSAEHERLIQTHLDTGRYANAEEVLEIALQLLTRLDTEHQAWLEDTRQKIAIGIAELDRGEGVDGPSVMNQYLQKFQSAKASIEENPMLISLPIFEDYWSKNTSCSIE